MITVGRLARKHGLSRSTLLYYDRIGLLRPSARTGGGYRAYTAEDEARLADICLYRQAGLPLKEIHLALDGPDTALKQALARRLEALNGELGRLREQQRFIVGILKRDAYHDLDVLTEEAWVALLAASGLDEGDRHRWHAEFERQAPKQHQAFLELLCIAPARIKAIREASREAWGEARSPRAGKKDRPGGRAR